MEFFFGLYNTGLWYKRGNFCPSRLCLDFFETLLLTVLFYPGVQDLYFWICS